MPFILITKIIIKMVITVSNVWIHVNYKFDNLTSALQETIEDLLKRWFKQKLDRYIKKYADPNDLQAHLNINIKRNSKGLYDWNFNFKIWNKYIIYKREDFKNVIDLVNHFFDHVKEELSKK